MPPDHSRQFQLEANAKHVDPIVIADIVRIYNDPKATPLEQRLARCLYDLAKAHNEMVDALELGQVTLTVFEKDVRIERRP